MIKKISNGKISKDRLEVELTLSRRQSNRLTEIYQTNEKRMFIGGNLDCKPASDLSDKTKKHNLDLYNKKYEAFNIAYFTEKSNEVERRHTVLLYNSAELTVSKEPFISTSFSANKKKETPRITIKGTAENKFSQKKKIKY